MAKRIAVVNYGMGNLASVSRALETSGGQAVVTDSPAEIASADAVVLPGVGAFGRAMEELAKRKLLDPIKEFASTGKPLLGICLGMQVFFEESEEAPGKKGLGLLPGRVRRFPNRELRIPHMGWNEVKCQISNSKCQIFEGIKNGSYFYFVHSYFCEPTSADSVIARTEYGESFASAAAEGNLIGVQFHPEKSHRDGLRFLANFVRQSC